MEPYNEDVYTLVSSLAETSKLIAMYVKKEAETIEGALKLMSAEYKFSCGSE